MRVALFEPDIPQNAGAIFRLAACLDVEVDVIGPCGFVMEDRRLKRVMMDYGVQAKITSHTSWTSWYSTIGKRRIALLTTKGNMSYTKFAYNDSDTLLLGRESAGAPDYVHAAADARLLIPMAREARSLNAVSALAIVLGEALRQTRGA